MTRATVADALYRAEGSPSVTVTAFPDIPAESEYANAASWGNLCIFYRDFRNSTSLIPLGPIDSGMDVIGGMTEDFTVTMEAVK